MDNQTPQNAGSFMAPAGGGGQAILNAMQRRGLTGGVTNQMGGGTPAGQQAVLMPTIPSGMPQQNPQPQQPAPQPTGQPIPLPPTPQGSPTPPSNPEALLILKSMSNYLDHIANVNEAQNGVAQ